MMAREGVRRRGEEETVVTARERMIFWRGRMDSGGLAAILDDEEDAAAVEAGRMLAAPESAV